MITIEWMCATMLLIGLSIYTYCYTKSVMHMRQQDIEFEQLLKQIEIEHNEV